MAIKKSKKVAGKKNGEKLEIAMTAEKKPELIEKTIENTAEGKEDNNIKALRWILGIGIILIIIVFAGVWYSEASKKIDYAGLDFKKEMFGQLQLYTTQLNGYNTNGQQIGFKLAFRNDPRTLKDIPVNTTIRFLNNKETYISLNLTDEMSKCQNASIALSNYGYFMKSLGFSVKSAGITKEIANKYNMTIANCDGPKNNTILVVTASNETSIGQSSENRNCYILRFKDCEVLQVLERFEVATLAQFKGEKLE